MMLSIWFLVFVNLIVLLCICEASNEDKDSASLKWLIARCKNIWRPENLIGRCFGFKAYQEIPELQGSGLNITTAGQCRKLCCNLNEKCTSWQFESTQPACKIGGIARLGLEATGTPDWCDPFPDMKWNGRILVDRKNDKTCTWGDHLPKQCYGLGGEQKSSTGQQLNTESCAEACCKDKSCNIWQELPGRGCYYSSKSEASCSKDPERFYTGGRKCLPKFCSGMEEKILGPGYATATVSTTSTV